MQNGSPIRSMRFVPVGQVHLRGMHYRILAASNVRLPDGTRFVDTADTAQLIEDAGKAARYLGLVASAGS